MSSPILENDKLHGWLLKCHNCGFIEKYDQYNPKCEKCNSNDIAIYFECPICHAKTSYGNRKCMGCNKDISYLISAPYIKQEQLEEKKNKKRRIRNAVLIGIGIFILSFVSGLSILVSCVIALGAAVFTWTIK